MSAIKALLFDLDETLLHGDMGDSIVAACRMLAAAGAGLDAERLHDANTAVWNEYWPEVEERWTLGSLSTADLGLEAWVRTLRACDCDDAALAVKARDAAWLHQCERFRLFDDVLPLLDAVAGRFLIALITNGASDLQREKLRRTGLEGRCDAIVVSGEAGYAKPDAAVFRLALEQLSLDPVDAWYVGDNPRNDVGGATAAGLTSVWINRRAVGWPEVLARAHYEIASLTELVALIEGR